MDYNLLGGIIVVNGKCGRRYHHLTILGMCVLLNQLNFGLINFFLKKLENGLEIIFN